MACFLCRLAFLGGDFHGFQVQGKLRTVALVFQEALEALLGCRPDIKGCSRTDAGVHARGFCVSFSAETAIPPERLPFALNRLLPPDLSVLDCRQVREDFHARYDATGKRYVYLLSNSSQRDPFLTGRVWHRPGPLALAPMRQASAALLGEHDFSAFRNSGGKPGSAVRTLFEATVEREGALWRFSFAGDGFLYNMVRILTGTLAEVGAGARAPQSIAALLASGNRAEAGMTAPPEGLCLDEVFYPSDIFLEKG